MLASEHAAAVAALTTLIKAASDNRELEALHSETLHMRSLCLDLEAKSNSDAQVMNSLQREKQLLVMQNTQLLAMQPSNRNSRGSFESKGDNSQRECVLFRATKTNSVGRRQLFSLVFPNCFSRLSCVSCFIFASLSFVRS